MFTMLKRFGQISPIDQEEYKQIPTGRESSEDGDVAEQQYTGTKDADTGLSRKVRLSSVLAIQVLLLAVYTTLFGVLCSVARSEHRNTNLCEDNPSLSSM
jgi:hypothetical protein